MANEMVTIVIKAPLSREELQELLQKVREIEQIGRRRERV